MRLLGWPRELLKRAIKLSTEGFDCGWHVRRYYMYARIGDFFTVKPRAGRILSISEPDALHSLLDQERSELVIANHPEHNLISLGFPDASFHFVVCDEVLENVEGNPQQAVAEIHRVLKSGGWAIVTTCLMNPIHGAPRDFRRFTKDGLPHLCRRFREIGQAEGGGNPWVHIMQMIGVRGIPIPHARSRPLNRVGAKTTDPRP